MKGQEEWPILDPVEVKSVHTTCEVEGTCECSLVCEERAIDVVGGSTVLCNEGLNRVDRYALLRITDLLDGNKLQTAGEEYQHGKVAAAIFDRSLQDLQEAKNKC